MIDLLLQRFREFGTAEALVWRGRSFSYQDLVTRVERWHPVVAEFAPGRVVGLEADFSPDAVAAFFALAQVGAILVPMASDVPVAQRAQRQEIGEIEILLRLDPAQDGPQVLQMQRLSTTACHPFYQELRKAQHPGLVLFSSGSTGAPKGMVHDLNRLLAPLMQAAGRPWRSIAFLLFDHIGGLNTMLHMLAGGGCLITVENRDPDHVLAAVERHRAELLPTSPTFLNLILLSDAWRRHDLRSLKVISYGTEPMPESTLRRFHELLPSVRLSQTYGLSESGILKIKSKSSDSLWVKPLEEGYHVRIVDGMLQVKSETAMLGYLNAPSPFTADGWLVTGDAVETDGEFMRILGRTSELILVGGEKVFPAEVEDALLELENVAEVVVSGEKNPITGAIVCATIRLARPEARALFLQRLRAFGAVRLKRHQVPVRVVLTDQPLHSERFKKSRAVFAGTQCPQTRG